MTGSSERTAAAVGDRGAVEELERLAVAAHLGGRDDESARAWERAPAGWLELGDLDRAALCGFWLGFGLLLRGAMAQAGGWLARATRLVDDAASECVAHGYLQVVVSLAAVEGGDHETAEAAADEVVRVARQFDDEDLLALGLLTRGEAALAAGETTRGMGLLDEVMVAVATGHVASIPAGIVYCAVIEACMAVFDLRRAAEWTDALDRWCGTQPDLVAFRGQCLVHRSQLLQARGAWGEALSEAERARRHLSEPLHPALGLASTSRASSTGCGAGSPTPRWPTGRPAGRATSRLPVWPSCGWRRARPAPPPSPSGAWSRRAAAGSPGRRCSPPAPRSCSASARWRRPGRPSTS